MALTDQEKEVLKRADLVIVDATSTWQMRQEGDLNGTYAGVFKFRCYLTPTQQIAANREYRELLGPNPTFASEHETFLAYALTQLKYRVISAPPFWVSQNPGAYAGDLADENILSLVLDAAFTSEMKYKTQIKQKKLDAATRGIAATDALMRDGESTEDESEDEDDKE